MVLFGVVNGRQVLYEIEIELICCGALKLKYLIMSLIIFLALEYCPILFAKKLVLSTDAKACWNLLKRIR